MIKEEKEIMMVYARIPDQPVGWLETQLSESTMERLQEYIETAKKNPISVNDILAGNISKSLLIKDKDDWFFQTVLAPLMSKFIECYPSYAKEMNILTEAAPCCLNTFWVNFQKENEFNPYHNHSGIWSFVVWVKIPTDWREQHALPISANSNLPHASDFEFQYITMLGNTGYYPYHLDKTSEGGMLFFPAKLMHAVYPFYDCDKERISISGNIKFNISAD